MRTIYRLLLASIISANLAACAKDEEESKTTTVSADTQPASEQAAILPVEDKAAHGEEAHSVHCYKCHTDEVYTRENRFVKSIDALSKQVVRCRDGNDVPWFDEDTEAVVQFLNNKYYRF